MSTVSFVEKKCFVCEEKNLYSVGGIFMLTSEAGLDSRPANMSPLFTLVMLCPACKYANSDISKGREEDKTLIHNPEYQKIVLNETIPETVRKFLSWSCLLYYHGQFSEAVRSLLCAVWIAEQHGLDRSLISVCRQKALDLMKKCRERGMSYELTQGKEMLIASDLYRREGQFDEALQLCRAALALPNLTEDLEFVLLYEESLCLQKNVEAKTTADAERDL